MCASPWAKQCKSESDFTRCVVFGLKIINCYNKHIIKENLLNMITGELKSGRKRHY